MKTIELNRRQFLKTTGAIDRQLQSCFPRSPVFGSIDGRTRHGRGSRRQLDSWLAVAPDGTVTVFSGKVDLGTGVETALAQIVAEELDVPFNHIHMIGLDTSKAIDQGIDRWQSNYRTRRPAIAPSRCGGAPGVAKARRRAI